MSSKENQGKCFTFVWKLENLRYCIQKKGELVESPSFVIDSIDQTKWKLWLYPRGERDDKYVGYFLHREEDSKGADEVEIVFDFAFISDDDTILKSIETLKHSFLKNRYYGYPRFEAVENVFNSRRATFLPLDTLTVRCKIWKSIGEMDIDYHCSARTRIGIEKKSFVWNVKNFCYLTSEKKCTHQMKSIENEAPLMSVSLTEGLNSAEIILFKLSLQDQTIKFSALCLFLIDASGNRVECNQEEMWFDDLAECKQLTFSYTRMELLRNKSMYLPNDTLSLLFKWTFSKGIVSEEIEEVQSGCENPTPPANNDETSLLKILVDSVKSLYDEHFLSDVKLKTKTGEFPAHKLILSASSSVFKAMFSRDMKEANSNSVDIEDLSDDTIGRMLLYVYTTRVEDLNWESAYHLYVASDRYAIFNLKRICSSYLKDHLSTSNACEVLLLSDLHADNDLKSIVQNYILLHGKQITNSDEWKELVETNAKLAVETLCLQFK